MNNIDATKGYMLLAASIVKSAIDDYEAAAKANDKAKMKALEKWFKGKWCDALTFGCGEYILYKVQKELGVR